MQYVHSVAAEREAVETGVVVKKVMNGVEVDVGGRRVACRQVKGGCETGEIVVGDDVRLETLDDEPRLVDVLPRRNRFGRRAAGARPMEQVIAANVDVVVVVLAVAQPKPRWTLVDRVLAAAEAAGLQAAVCLSKSDLAQAARVRADGEQYQRVGYPLCATTHSGGGIDALRECIQGRRAVLIGPPGVGKTTLVRLLCNDATAGRLRSTSHAEMYAVDSTTSVIDTPGVREFRLWLEDGTELSSLLPELRTLGAQCRFGASCSHVGELGCAVKQAVEDGAVDPRRYRSYLRMREGAAQTSRSTPTAREDERSFCCVHCGVGVATEALGTEHRNHCPHCLWSRHLDVRPGDRAASCGGALEPIAVWSRPDGEWALVHRCQTCGALRANRVAGDDNSLALMSLAARALASPPFPLQSLAQRS